MKVYELLSDESKWAQYALAKTKEGSTCDPLSREAVCWCLRGAVIKCYGMYNYEEGSSSVRVLEKIATELTRMNVTTWISAWQDNKTRTFAEVRDLTLRLDI